MASSGCSRRRVRFLVALLIAAASSGETASAQSRVVGRVVKPGGDSVVAVGGAWVTLHRVGTDRAGPLDSTRTAPNGSFALSYARTGADDAIYFVSSSHGGVAYFTRPLHEGVDEGDDTEIMVFDTTSRPIRTTVRGRHVVVGRTDPSGKRTVTEVFDLSNDTSVTRVARNDSTDGAVWAAILPTGAGNPVVSDGDIPAAAVRFDQGRALVYAPFSPGIKQLAYHYTVSEGAFPLTVPLERPTSVLEVLLEEPMARVEAPGIKAMPPVAVQGHEFRRFISQDVPASSVLTVRVPEVAQPLTTWFAAGLTLIIGGAMTWALARAMRRRT
ncbi:MAG: hypothetical protein ACR2M1_10745 [Gemmatimonadaceae bacterium]